MDFDISLNGDSGKPLYRRLCDELKAMIVSGKLRSGQSLPSSRDLAEVLKISRVTVVRSYEELVCQGYLEAAVGKGTFVSRRFQAVSIAGASETRSARDRSGMLSAYARWLLGGDAFESSITELAEPEFATTDPDLVPSNLWRKLLLRHCAQLEPAFDERENIFGYPPLREAIVEYLQRARGIHCQVENIVLFGGTQHAMNVTARLLIDAEDVVAVENPGFPLARHAFLAQRARLHPVPVDEEGMLVDELLRLEEPPKVVHITPSHQDPTGAILSERRRRQLLEWAAATGSLIVEDDYDGELQSGMLNVPALKGEDSEDSVIYHSSVWRALYPLISLSYMVVPDSLVDAFGRAKFVSKRVASLPEQRALAEFIGDAHLERCMKQIRAAYDKRRRALALALTQHLGDLVELPRKNGGVSLLIRFHFDLTPQETLDCARKAGLSMVSSRPCYLDGDRANEFVISVALSKEEELLHAVAHFSQLIKQ